MKKIFFILLLMFSVSIFGAPPPPPQQPNPPDPGGGGVPIGGSPIGDGVFVLVALSLAYGSRVWYNKRKRKLSE